MTDSIYDLSFTSNTGEEVPLEQFRGQPMLIVNTASKISFVSGCPGS